MVMVTLTNSKLLLFHLHATCCFLLSYHVVASPFSFSFDFSNISTYRLDDLLFEGNASLNGRVVDLTCNAEGKPMTNCKGRMSYNHPVPFYDTSTGEVASFSTRFNFAITVSDNITGDGMAFFLSSYPSMLPPDSGGGNLGLHDGDGMNAKGRERIIAVEFDKFQNFYDPSSDHIGIDINTVKASVNTTTLPNSSLNGSMTATITFNSTTRMLLASLQFDDNPAAHGPVQVSALLPDPITDLLPSEVAVGFSAATGRYVELHRIISWSFNSTLPFKGVTSPGIPRSLLIGGASLLLVILIVLIWFIVACYMHIRQGKSFVEGVGDLAKRFEYHDLATATDNFSKSRELGRGAFGVVYEGSLKDQNGQQQRVAVKKIKGSNGDFADFHAELKTISKTSHKNLVWLLGWCSTNRSNFIDFMCWCSQKQSIQLFLVYELVPNGNLDMHLKSTEQVLPWERRYNIVKDIGTALRYIHHECNECILHRDIKPSNILLDEQFNAKLADFGLSRIAHHKNEGALTNDRETFGGDFSANAVALTVANGTIAYMDPKCMKDGIVSFNRRSDVYSFGIVLLEISCTGKSRVEVWDLYKCDPENMMVAADARLNGNFDVAQMQNMAILGLWCSFADDARRPSMLQAMEVLEHDAALPNLIEYEHGVSGSEEHESIDNGVDGSYSAASLANKELIGLDPNTEYSPATPQKLAVQPSDPLLSKAGLIRAKPIRLASRLDRSASI